MTVFACKKEEKLGLNVQPDSGKIGFAMVDSFDIDITHIKADTVLTSNRINGLLGSYVDPEFGTVQSNFLTQLRLSKTGQNFEVDGFAVDSGVLSIRMIGMYGKAGLDSTQLTAQSFEVFELNDTLSRKTNYFQFSDKSLKADVIGELKDYKPNLKDSIPAFKGTGKEPPQMRITMKKSWVESLMKSGTANFATNEAFQNYMKGIAIVPKNSLSSGQGEIIYFNPNSIYTKLTVYYHTKADDSLNFELIINDSCGKYSKFIHNHSGTDAGVALTNSNKKPEKVYLQAMGGPWAKVEFKDLFTKFENQDVVVNLAEIRISEATNTNNYPAAPRMTIVQYTKDGDEKALVDNSSSIGGQYDADKDEYVFKISRHIQQLLSDKRNGVDNNFGFLIRPGNNGISANRTVIYGPGHNGANKLKLKIYYTPIN